jgi:hypothetical protein
MYKHLHNFKVIHALILVALTVFYIPRLFSPGMFFDGLILSDVAITFANNFKGMFILPATNDYRIEFCDQPPLYFWILGTYYKLFGYGMLSVYVLKAMLASFTFYLLCKLNNQYKLLISNYTVPFSLIVLGYTVGELHGFIFEHLMLEALIVPLSLLSIITLNNYLLTKRLMHLLLFTALLTALFFTKGIQTQFVIGYLGCYALIYDKKNIVKYALYGTLCFIGVGLVFGLLLYFNKSAYTYFYNYWEYRIVASFTHAGEATTNYHFSIVLNFIIEYLLTLLLVIAAYFTTKYKQINLKFAYFMLLTAACGLLPLMVTLEQRRWYFAQAAPFYIIGLMYVVSAFKPAYFNWLFKAIKPLYTGVLLIIVALINISAIAYLNTHYKRDTNKLNMLMYVKNDLKIQSFKLNGQFKEYDEICVYAHFYDLNCYIKDTVLPYSLMHPHDSLKHKVVYSNEDYYIVKNN